MTPISQAPIVVRIEKLVGLELQVIIDRIFTFESTRVRQRAVPLLAERELFLAHLANQGRSSERLRPIAAIMIHIVRLMELSSLRLITPSEIDDAAGRWCETDYKVRGKYPKSPYHFASVALRWFRFADVLTPIATVKSEGEHLTDAFQHYLRADRGFSECAIRCYIARVANFLAWANNQHLAPSNIDVPQVDTYFGFCSELNLKPRTINGICCALRAYFRYTSARGLNSAKLARNIKNQPIVRYRPEPAGPEWKDVRRLLDHGFGTRPSELRASAITSLCAVYALRRCEVAKLKLSDIDWMAETITIRRGKSGRIHQFPLQFEVGQKILGYLQSRGICSCKFLFVTINPPHKPIDPSITWSIVSKKMKRLGIQSESFGVHALRHSCATKLLRDGSSLKDVAEFLGHSDMSSVSIYAKFDAKTLENVATFSLSGLV